MAKYIKSKSNYVLRSKHQTVTGGTVYERDFLTIAGADMFSPTEKPMYQNSNFRFVVKNGVSLRTKHKQGSWIINNCDNTIWWTSNCMGTGVSGQSKIVYNPDYTSLRDFAYYGSAMDLVRASIVDISLKFPAELYFTDKLYKNTDANKIQGLNTTNLYEIDNPFNIDLHSQDVDKSKVFNKYRYFCLSYKSYVDRYGNPVGQWSVTPQSETSCYGENDRVYLSKVRVGGIDIYACFICGEIKYFYTATAQNNNYFMLNSSVVEECIETLNDFERVLLNITSLKAKLEAREKALWTNVAKYEYRAVFDTPRFTDDGYFTKYEEYVWPSQYGWNPDLSGQAYQLYLERLMRLAEFHDEYDSDNIWRSMTHEAIKNLDWTFTRESEGLKEEYEGIDTSRIEPMLKLYGRQYDDIKRAIDNMGKMNNISYDKKNNVPDYFIDTFLSISGWDSKSVDVTENRDQRFKVQWRGETKNVTSSEVSDEILRRLEISSRYILSRKGTRKGLVELLGLFGFTEIDKDSSNPLRNPSKNEFRMEENIARFTQFANAVTVAETNLLKSVFDEDTAPALDDFYGIPVAQLGDTDKVVPWYDPKQIYDGGLYYQMCGGWGKSGNSNYWKKENLYNPITTATEYSGSRLSSGTFTNWMNNNEDKMFYTESQNSLRVVETLGDLLQIPKNELRAGDVCYVEDIYDIEEVYVCNSPDTTLVNGALSSAATHYFVLMTKDLFGTLGYYPGLNGEDAGYGWVNIPRINFANLTSTVYTDFSGMLNYGAKMCCYLESVQNTKEGNNPHVGYGRYDDGREYLRRIQYPLIGAYEEGYLPDTVTESQVKAITFGTPTIEIDNAKCCYYKENEIENSYKVMNMKNFTIYFNVNDKEFILKNVMLYLTQMLPSTTIFNYVFV